MVFSTNIFLFLFLPLFLAGYYAAPFRWRSAWILLASYAFYGWWRADFLALIFLSTLWTYLFGRAVAAHKAKDPRRAKLLLGVGVVGNLGVLAYFKYFNFGVESLNALLAGLGVSPLSAWEVLLPVGISFYVFQAVSYLVDVYREDAPPARNFLDLAAYIALFPQLIAGPILRYKDLSEQFRARTHTFAKFSEGALRFMVGFCKKVLIADAVAPIANAAFAVGTPSAADAWLGALAYGVQLFFDFSGYSDMAIGLGLMMGFRFRENFDHPYISGSITEFWRRWHISLSSWLRDYLYIPLGGNRRGAGRTYVNLMMVMLLGGLWHGAAWTFVIWGAWHGGILAVERFLGKRELWRPLPAVLAVPRTLALVLIGWVTFRAGSASEAFGMYAGMMGVNGLPVSEVLVWQLSVQGLVTLLVALLLIFVGPWWRDAFKGLPEARQRAADWVHLAVIPLFVLGVLRLSADSFSPFLYFQF
jgi:alginate O-acetyltransferase complex protein AlgI